MQECVKIEWNTSQEASLDLVIYREEEHYKMLANWWKDQNHPIIPAEYLPEQLGVICLLDDKPIVAGFLMCVVNSRYSAIEHLIANPEANKRDVYHCTKEGIKALLGVARQLGYSHVSCFTSTKGLEKLLKKIGFENMAQTSEKYGISL